MRAHLDADEILATATVRDLVIGSGLALEDRGTHVLRAIDTPWRIVAAVANRDHRRTRHSYRSSQARRDAPPTERRTCGRSVAPSSRRSMTPQLGIFGVLIGYHTVPTFGVPPPPQLEGRPTEGYQPECW